MRTASFDFTDTVVLVTGGGTGIGQAITHAFLDAGATVAISGRRADRLEQALRGHPAERTAALLTELSDDDWAQMRATNVDALFHLAKHAHPHLVASGGTLIAVSSVSGMRGDWGQAGYNATKAAVSNFVRSLALDWGADGVRVNAVAPAFTLTEITADMAADDEALAPFVNRVALGRPGQPADIAPAVLFLASEGARYVTGIVMPVDGGTSASTGQPHV